MKHLLLSPLLFLLACEAFSSAASAEAVAAPAAMDASAFVVRINSTIQQWNPGQPWEKSSPRNRQALGAIVGKNHILTTAEMVADASFIELETTDATHRAPAEVVCVDYEANLAMLKLSDETQEAEFFTKLKSLEVAPPPALRASLEMIQVEQNGQSLITSGQLLTADVVSTFLPGQNFLTFQVKASMQSSPSSYSLPVLKDGKLAGILSSYDAKDQISDVIATPLLARFIAESQKAEYQGFPNLGVGSTITEDKHFRSWLKLPETVGGVYISKVRKGSAAELAKLAVGDVILAIDGKPIDRRGYYLDPVYGSLQWVQMVRGNKSAGDEIKLSIWRDGAPLDITAVLTRQEESTRLVPNYTFGKAPNFLIKGGMIFQELTRPLLQAYGDEWESRAPLNFLDALSNPEKYQENHDRIVCLTGVIPTQATVGYESLRNLMISKVNGKPVRNMKDLISAFQKPKLGSNAHSIEFVDETIKVYLDDQMSQAIDASLLQRGLSKLSRAE